MMFGARYSIEATLVVQTPLHIGGSAEELGTNRDGETCRFTPVVRGIFGPVLPASSLKGCLRAALAEEDKISGLGEGSDHPNGKGAAAKLWLDHATLASGPENESLRGLCEDEPENGIFRARHMSRNPKTGAALDSHLFSREMVGTGATFALSAEWLSDSTDGLAPIIAPFFHGLNLGKGTTKGAGRVVLDINQLKLFRHTPQADGSLRKEAVEQPVLDRLIAEIENAEEVNHGRRLTLTLTCDGPFISVRTVGGEDGNVSEPLEQEGKPVLWPESLIGAMRSRARWLAEIGRAKEPKNSRPPNIPMDDPKLEHALNGARRVASESDLERLSSVERLFGVTGSRALLSVVEITCTNPGQTEVIMSNSIDRLTGGTRDGVLFGNRAFWAPEFKVTLGIEDENSCLDALLSDLQTNGIELGHGAAKGFGWFNVEVSYD